jgi:hypothetical protein
MEESGHFDSHVLYPEGKRHRYPLDRVAAAERHFGSVVRTVTVMAEQTVLLIILNNLLYEVFSQSILC